MGNKRVGIVNGTWQIISLAAALRARDGRTAVPACERVAVIAGVASPEFYDLMRRLSERLLGCTPVVLDEIISIQGVKEESSFLPIIKKIADRLDLAEVDELWVGTTEDWQEALIAEACPSAGIYAYEDGMGTYFKGGVPPAGGSKTLPARLAGLLVNLRRFQKYFLPRNPALVFKLKRLPEKMRGRIRGRFYFLSKFLPLPGRYAGNPMTQVSSEMLGDFVRDAADCYDLSTLRPEQFTGDATTVVVLGQCFSRGSSLSREKELDLYAGVIGELQQKGCRILWKDHPRLGEGFFEELKRRSNPAGFLEQFPAKISAPVEVLAGILPREGIVFASAMSTSLFYLSELYGYPAYQFADRFLDVIDGLHRSIGVAVAERFPDIREIECRTGENLPA